MIVRSRIKVFLLAVISTILLFLFSWSSPVYALGLSPSPWSGPDLTYPESEVLAIKANTGHTLFRVLEKSAEQGGSGAMAGLMLYYQHVRDFPKAVFWAKKGAHAGNPHAESYLGFAYYHGHGIQKNLKKSIYWLGKAASHHEYSSTYFLAYLHQHGEGGFPKNIHAAIPLYEAAARDGGFSAAQTLSEIYKNGEGVPQDAKRADYWAHFTPKHGLTSNEGYQKASIAFEKYTREGDPTAYKEEKKLELKGNSFSRDSTPIYYAIAWILLFLQVRRSWKTPEGSSAIFWGAICLWEVLYCAGYLLNIIEHVDSFMIWSKSIFYGVTAIMCGIIVWSALFRKSKKT